MEGNRSIEAPQRAPWKINKWLAFWIVGASSFISTLDAGVVGVALPRLVAYFDTTPSTILWVNVIFFVVGIGLLPTMGWIGDKRGRRLIFSLGFLLFTLGMASSALSQSVFQLIGGRFVQGIGNAMLMANGLAIIAQSFPSNERGTAIGLHGAVLGVGLAGGPAIGGVILDALGWQALFYMRVPLGVAGLAMAWAFLPRRSDTGKPLDLDYGGAVTLFLGMGSFLFVLSQSGSLGFGSPLVMAAGGGAIVMMGAFVFVERRRAQPLIELALFKVRQFRLFLFLHVLHYVVVGSVTFLVPFYLISGLEYSASKAGLFITAFFALRLPFAPVSGWLSDKFGPTLLSVTGLAIAVAGTLLLSRLGASANEWTIALSLLFAGLGSSMFEPTNSSGIMGALRLSQLGIASAAISMGRQVGLATGTALGGALFILRQDAHLAALRGVAGEMAPALSAAKGFGDATLIIVSLVGAGLVASLIERGIVSWRGGSS